MEDEKSEAFYSLGRLYRHHHVILIEIVISLSLICCTNKVVILYIVWENTLLWRIERFYDRRFNNAMVVSLRAYIFNPLGAICAVRTLKTPVRRFRLTPETRRVRVSILYLD